jgi:hypothetical protein
MTEPKPTYLYTPPKQVQRATIIKLNEVCNRALNQNAAMGNEALTRAIRAVQVHTVEELAKEPNID